ncbi:MAG: tyrosine-type recombinase/integrase [Thermoproteota archaeon]|nr:tyrosine-type recombinase/integrase [Thermoproteota archaeon]
MGFEPTTASLGDMLRREKRSLEAVFSDFKRFLMVDLQLEKQTADLHGWYLGKMVREIGKDWREINKEDLRTFLLKLKREKAVLTYKNYLSALKRFYRDFLQAPHMVKSFRFPNVPFKPKRIVSKKKVKKFYECLENVRDKATFLMLATSGLRKAELLGLRLKDIDIEKRVVFPNKSNRTKRTWITFFNMEAQAVLKEYLRNNGFSEENRIFPSEKTLRRAWKKAEEKSGIHITPQKLRKFFAKEMTDLDVPARFIDAFCGRVPKSVLAQHYTDYSSERLKKIYDNANLKVLS